MHGLSPALWGGADNTTAEAWAHRESLSRSGAAPPLLWHNASLWRQFHVATSLEYVQGKDNQLANEASRLTHLPQTKFLAHFNEHFLQATSWCLLHPTPDMLQRLHIVLLAKRLLKESVWDDNIPTTLSGGSGQLSVPGWVSPPASMELSMLCLSSKSLHSKYSLASWLHEASQSKRE